MKSAQSSQLQPQSILVVDGEIISRYVIASYLRHCGYSVVEAANINEAHIAIPHKDLSIDVILFDVSTLGEDGGNQLTSWAKTHNPDLEIKLVGGVEMAAQAAADLCKNGPHLKKPYEPDLVVKYIELLRSKLHA